ncbi:MAG TPA: hypothetical protein PKN24_14270 [bacterium]|nr:hypothetical protein [bacterium]
MIAAQLTDEQSIEPEVVAGIQTLADLFGHYKPRKTIDFVDENGQPKPEEIAFGSLADMTPRGLAEKSEFLKNLMQNEEFISDFIRQIRSNKALQAVLADEAKRKAFLQVLDKMIAEIEV